MKTWALGGVLLVAIFGSASLGYIAGATLGGSPTNRNSGSSTIATCTFSGEAIGVSLRVVAINYSTQSTFAVAGANISGDDVFFCYGNKQVRVIAPASTNSSGWAMLSDGGTGIYYLNVTYPDSNLVYTLSIPVRPVSMTYATFNASTGGLTTSFCEFNANCSISG